MFGSPGSGKGTLSDVMNKKLGLKHISTGDILRAEIKAKSEIGKIADSYISKGRLAPDEVIIKMLENILDTYKESKGIIFDGFPRTILQADALKKMLNERGTDILVMFDLKADEELLIKRLLRRGEITGRTDDNLETILLRLEVYREQTAPVIEYYKDEKKYIEIDSTGEIEEVYSRIEKALEQWLNRISLTT